MWSLGKSGRQLDKEIEQEEETRQRQGRKECSLMETVRTDRGIGEMQCFRLSSHQRVVNTEGDL